MDSLNNSLDTIFAKMEDFISTKTVVGDAITVGDITLLPLIEVSVGVAAGTKENEGKGNKNIESGAGGLGAKITPSAIIMIKDGNAQMINIKNQDALNKLIDMAPGAISKLNFGSFFNKKENDNDIGGKSEEKEDTKKDTKFEDKIILE